jgi:hypothetical protein
MVLDRTRTGEEGSGKRDSARDEAPRSHREIFTTDLCKLGWTVVLFSHVLCCPGPWSDDRSRRYGTPRTNGVKANRGCDGFDEGCLTQWGYLESWKRFEPMSSLISSRCSTSGVHFEARAGPQAPLGSVRGDRLEIMHYPNTAVARAAWPLRPRICGNCSESALDWRSDEGDMSGRESWPGDILGIKLSGLGRKPMKGRGENRDG